MKTDKRFYIYKRSGGFMNKSRLNEMGFIIYTFFKTLKAFNEKYFHRVNWIFVTSQDREGAGVSAHKRPGRAIDIVINPPEYMLYYFGLLHSLYPFNLYLGTVKADGSKNLHVHVDNDYSRWKNKKAYEHPNGKLSAVNKNSYEYLKEVYGWNFLDSIQDFGNFEKAVNSLLLTYYPSGSKIKLDNYLSMPVKTQLKEKIDDLWQDNKYIFYIAGGLALYYVYQKTQPQKVRLISD